MLSLSSLIEFLLDLLRDPQVADDFARDPQGTLAANGLAGVTAADVRDVRPLLADHPGVRCGDDDRGGGGGGGQHARPEHHAVHHARPEHHGHHGRPQHDDDPVREIHHVQQQYVVHRPEVHHHTTTHHTTTTQNHYEFTYVDNSVHAEEGATVIQDSFNQDNDGVDNKGGTIDDSVVAGGDANGSGNSTEVVVIEDSFDEEHATTVTDSGNTTTEVVVTDSMNDESTEIDDSFTSESSTTVSDSFAGGTINDSYAVQGPLADAPAEDEAAATTTGSAA